MPRKKKDPYESLKVKNGASKEQIRRAHRRRSMETHPDRGGDGDEFKEVQSSYRLLMDDGRRERYDRTGEADETPDNEEVKLAQMLSSCFLAVVQAVVGRGQNPEQQDLLGMMFQQLEGNLRQGAAHEKELVKLKRPWEKMLGRFTVDDGTNYLDSAVRHQLDQIDMKLEQLAQSKAKLEKLVAMLKRFAFRRDKEEANREMRKFVFGPTTATTNQW